MKDYSKGIFANNDELLQQLALQQTNNSATPAFSAAAAPNTIVPTSMAQPNVDMSASSSPTSSYVGAGIGAAGQTIGMLAQLASAQQAREANATQNAAARGLSEKMTKAQLAQQQDQFDKSNKFNTLITALKGIDNTRSTNNSARDIQRQDQQLLSDVLSRVFLK